MRSQRASSEEAGSETTITSSTWYDVAMDPIHSDMSDHSSDDDPYIEPGSDQEEEI